MNLTLDGCPTRACSPCLGSFPRIFHVSAGSSRGSTDAAYCSWQSRFFGRVTEELYGTLFEFEVGVSF